MFFFQIQKLKKLMITRVGLVLTLFILAGCVAQTAEKSRLSQNSQETSQVDDSAQGKLGQIREINSLVADIQDRKVEIHISGSEKLFYTSIKQSFPFGIAIYLPETKIADGFKTSIRPNDFISDVVVDYADKEMTTVKVLILLIKDLNYDVVETDQSLKIVLSQGVQKDFANQTNPSDAPSSETSLGNSPPELSGQTAKMTHIEFNTMEDGKSDIVVETDRPVKYDITSGENDKLYLNLYDTVIPNYHKRPLLTQYFKSAVESLVPANVPGKKKNSKIEIKIRDWVPYRVVQDQNRIALYFEPTALEPPKFAKARKTSGFIAQGESAHQGNEKSVQVQYADNPSDSADTLFGGPKQYKGEKIKLDFYETDIKNVFRILKSVGGLNFAIDQDVQGKVTLSLEEPVPWDQVLDLVLKMNGLGQKQEGNVIRIATLDTLRKEEKLFQDAVAERKKSLEDKESLEPLMTEYIPINYSDAATDIKPHIDQVLTKERGKSSVDKRTNTIIVTDTQMKIDQIKETIYRLDKVTPQIMIEARVVEVSKDFSRELGLGLSFGETQTPHIGKSNDYNVALNFPSSSPATSGSFNFYNILGSDFLNIKAQIAAAETKGDVKVVSSPRILTLDNKKARIKQGLEYAYLERDDTGGSSVKFKNIDLLLEVTPHVTPDKRISMTVYLTKNDIDSVTDGVPSLSTNEAETELLVNDNDTVVIGGIVKTTDSNSTSGTPVLSGIPILGRLFRTDINKDKRNELLIFLTPSIIQLEQKNNTLTRVN